MMSLIIVGAGLAVFGGAVGYLSTIKRQNKEMIGYHYHKQELSKLRELKINGQYKVIDVDKIGHFEEEL